MRYAPAKIEKKWQAKWAKEKIYEPDLKSAKSPFYNLMMFPYPSGEGLHVGHAYTFSGADLYGRYQRMRGQDVFQPIGYDSFGIHSENYALKVGMHPLDLMKKTTKRYEEQLKSLGIGYAWKEVLSTHEESYYKWTQWIFLQMFKKGLAYRKKASVNWCPGCKTVLADEQVISGKCERCSSEAIKKDLEQWFFKITDYAEKLLNNLEKIDWTQKVKIAQKNWIGKSEGAEISFPLDTGYNYILLHGFKGSSEDIFFPWLKTELKKRDLVFYAPDLPNAEYPREEEQVEYVLKNAKFDEKTIIFGHSLGAVVAMKVAEKLDKKIAGLVLAGGFSSPQFKDHPRPFHKTFDWNFNFKKIKANTDFVKILSDINDYAIYLEQGKYLQENIGGELIETLGKEPHFTAAEEPEIWQALVPSVRVFTTRPDTLFGATYLVLAPEHALVQNSKFKIQNFKEVEEYAKKAKTKSEADRIADGREKTGVELKGIMAVNPANGEKIPIWAADYVLGHVGAGAIMAVPAHDERDFEFAKKFNLLIKIVICPHYPEKICPVLDRAYIGEGHLVGSGKFDGMSSQKARWEITKFVGGEKKNQYRLRDWLISRQRYWGPPIPMIYCETCGWQPVPEKDLPVKLPYTKEFRPTGTDQSPLATIEKFYKVRCPKCKAWAKRETDVSDTFLDSAWYYLRYPSVKEKKKPWSPAITKKWFPVDSYIGGAEHSVLHLLYVRFISMALHDIGVLDFSARGAAPAVGQGSDSVREEPFPKFRAHGLLIKDGAKMSKSKGNVINPDEYIRAYGADALRMYLMFLGPYEQGGDFRDTGIKGITRFLERVWKFAEGFKDLKDFTRDRLIHKTIKKVTEDIENLQYNTSVSALMVLLNSWEAEPRGVTKKNFEYFLKLLAPFAPHMTEEIWREILKNKRSIHQEKWPEFDPAMLVEESFELIIQINGKFRGRISVPRGISEEEAKDIAMNLESVRPHLAGKPRKIIFVPDKLINFVI